jgi:uncharacterized protein (TIRG00374 family)
VVTAQLGALALAIWLLIVPRVHQAGAPLRMLLDIDSGWIVLAIVAELASLTAYALTTRAILPSATRPGLGRVLRIDLSSIALTHCVPSGGAAGTVLSWRLLAAAGVPSGQAAAAKLAQGLFATTVLQVLLLCAFCSGLPTTGLGRWNTAPAALCLIVLLVVLVVALSLRRPGVRAACRRAVRSLPRFGQRLADSAGHVYRRHRIDQLAASFRSRPVMLRAAVFTAANWALDAAALWAAVAAYGHPVAVEGLATAIAIQTFAAWLPITPGGLGLADGMMIPALTAFGASGTSAVLGVLTWRVIAYWLPMPLGALAYGSLRLGRDGRRRVR